MSKRPNFKEALNAFVARTDISPMRKVTQLNAGLSVALGEFNESRITLLSEAISGLCALELAA
jgi:hypothetical protein